MTVCPHCGQRMLMRFGARLSPKKADMFDVIKYSGTRGMLGETLAWVFYPDKPKTVGMRTVAVTISQINDILEETGVKILAERGEPYRLVPR